MQRKTNSSLSTASIDLEPISSEQSWRPLHSTRPPSDRNAAGWNPHRRALFSDHAKHQKRPAMSTIATSANRARAISLYRGVLQAARQTFVGDQATNAAWRAHMRQHFRSAKNETDAEKIETFFKEAEDIVRILKSNVVQGTWRDESQAYRECIHAPPRVQGTEMQ